MAIEKLNINFMAQK